MSPVTSVKFLAVEKPAIRSGNWGGLGLEVGNIRNPLLLVDYQIFDEKQILRSLLCDKIFRCVAVGSSIIHVHVQISTSPLRS